MYSLEEIARLEDAVQRVRAAAEDMQATGNSRALGDPTANVWLDASLKVFRALDGA